MANRHDVQKKARGGHAAPPLGGGNKDVAKEAFGKKEKKASGGAAKKPDQKATGGPAKPRLDKRARGGGTKSPFSAAHFSTKGDAGK